MKPRTLDFVPSAAVTLSGLTAWQALFTHAGLERGQRVLIHGGAGGVGTYAVQLAHGKGAHVITTSSGANLDFLRSLGADETIDYTKARFEDVLCDVVLDAVGGDMVERSWTIVAKVFPLAHAREAFELGLQRHARSKIVPQVREDAR